jgi:hypothetical protein
LMRHLFASAGRSPQAVTIFFMSTSDSLEQVILAQGRMRTVAIATTLVSWGVHVPATVLLVKYWKKDMRGVFLGVLSPHCNCDWGWDCGWNCS